MIVAIVIAVGCSPIASSERAPRYDPTESKQLPLSTLTELPLSFIPTEKQGASEARYHLHGQGASIWFTPSGLVLSLKDRAGTSKRSVLRLEFVGARPVLPVPKDRAPGVISYFKGSPSEWKTGLPTYRRISYRELWPGITLAYSGTQDRLKYTLQLSPGADPSMIRLAWRGANSLRLDQDGNLVVSTPGGSLKDAAPTAYQEVGGRRVNVPVSYAVDGMTYGFQTGAYDSTRPLVIDPAILVYAGFLGGSGNDFDEVAEIAVDVEGNAYVTGFTDSSEATFPETIGPDLTFNGGFSDAFVAKISPSGTSLSYVGYIGGDSHEFPYGIAVGSDGSAYVAGLTGSTEATFPVTVGPDLTFNGSEDAFVAKVNPSGTALTYAGYVGGSASDAGGSIAVGPDGSAYLSGGTESTEATFPVLVGPDLTHNGLGDAFVAKVNPEGTGLAFAGYIGGSGDEGGVIALDPMGNIYVAGGTSSTEATFPVTVGPDLTYNGELTDAYVAKVNSSGSALVYAGYIGSSGIDTGLAIAVDSVGSAYVTGGTDSGKPGFPVTVGPDVTPNGLDDAYVVKVNPQGTALSYAGYVGGSGSEYGLAIALDSGGSAYVTGFTDSTETTFPVMEGPDLTYNGGPNDAFVAKVNPSGTALTLAGYIGGSDFDFGTGIAVDARGNAYLTGGTKSNEATFPVTIGPDLTYNGGFYDAFVAKIATEFCQGQTATHLGTSGADVITGTFGPDVIMGLGGDDQIDGGAGDDRICAGEGNDAVTGGAGNDRLDGEGGTDRLIESADVNFTLTNASLTGVGTDILASIEAATITGGPGETLIDASGFTGPVVLTGGDGEDVLIGGPASDAFDGGNGHVDKVVAGGDVNFTLTNTSLTGLGNDTLAGIELVTLYGGPSGQVIDASSFSGSTFIAAGGGTDRVTGGSSRDVVFGAGGKDRLAGRGGRDILDGGPQADRLLGGAGRDRLGGRGGNDRLLGGTNRDRLNGGKGKDFCLGGPGSDTLNACEFPR